jgi:hypothetical protein
MKDRDVREAIDSVYNQIVDLEDYEASETRRMATLSSRGLILYSNAQELLQDDGEKKGVDTLTGFRLATMEVSTTKPTKIVFGHFIAGPDNRPRYLEGDALIHLEETYIQLPFVTDTRDLLQPAIGIFAQFPRPYAQDTRIFAFTETGKTINLRGNYVSLDEMQQASNILKGLTPG